MGFYIKQKPKSMCFGKLNIRSIFFGKEKVWPSDYEIILNHYEVRVLTGASWSSILVTANTNDWYVISDVNWMTASKISNTQCNYEWTQNEGDERVGHLKFMVDGVEYARCTITQVAAVPSHTYIFTMDPDVETSIAYTGDTLAIGIRSLCDGSPQELSYVVQDNGQTPNWIIFLQRQERPYENYNYVYYFGINTNSGSVRHAGFTFTQSGSNNTLNVSITQQAYTSAFDGLTIKATRATSNYGYWVIGTSDNGMGGPPPYYQQRAVVIACDTPITSPKNVTYTLTVSRLKSLSNSGLGISTITKTITQFISPGSQVTPVSGGKAYYGKYVIIPDTKWVEGTGWVAEEGTDTTLSPHPSQDVSDVSISNVTTT